MEETRAFVNLTPNAELVLEACSGSVGDNRRNLAFLSGQSHWGAVGEARVPTLSEEARQLPPVAAAQGGLLWRVTGRIVFVKSGGSWNSFEDLDPCDLALQTMSQDVQQSLSPSQKIKMASIADTAGEPQFGAAEAAQNTKWHQRYITVMGSSPAEQPTADQLQALLHRTSVLRGPPHVFRDAHGRNAVHANKCRTWMVTADGKTVARSVASPLLFWTGVAGFAGQLRDEHREAHTLVAVGMASWCGCREKCRAARIQRPRRAFIQGCTREQV